MYQYDSSGKKVQIRENFAPSSRSPMRGRPTQRVSFREGYDDKKPIYKKPWFWIALIAVIAVIVISVVLYKRSQKNASQPAPSASSNFGFRFY